MARINSIGDHTFWVRMPIDTATEVATEAGALGIPVTEFFRRCVALYFETKQANQVSAAPTLTPAQSAGLIPSESPLSPVNDEEDERFNFRGKAD